MTVPPAVPVTLLTGFLGAGKTTVLNRILVGDHDRRIAVLVNDFGALDIADEIVAERTTGALRLTNGCICCSLKEGLVSAIMQLLAASERPEHIVMEASGVADPTGIATTLLAPVFRRRTRLDAVICVVDACELAADHQQRDLILRQLMVSDLILLNKVDRAGRRAQVNCEKLIRGWLAQARIVPTVHGDAPLDVLLSSDPARAVDARFHDRRSGGSPPVHNHLAHAQFAVWEYHSAEPLCADALRQFVRDLPGSVYRLKGLVRLAGAVNLSIVQGVGRRLDFVPTPATTAAGTAGRIMVIGAEGSLDPQLLQRQLDACRRPVPRH